jgi:alcohol dehydrogenase (NADP+)
MRTKAYGTYAATQPLEPMDIQRRAMGPHDVKVDITYCGVCHSDLHHCRQDWGVTHWPIVPGHEIVGHVTSVGPAVSRFKIGDTVGVGCIIDSCGRCPTCRDGQEQFCDQRVLTYNTQLGTEPGGHTLGGYAENIIAHERFVFRITHTKDQLPGVGPLLCAGITTYSPLKAWGAGPGKRVGIVGIGGLGHMGVKLSRAFGAHTVAFTSSESKREAAVALGADEVILTSDSKAFERYANSFDLILDTVSSSHDLNSYAQLLGRDGTLCVLGVPDKPHTPFNIVNLIFQRRKLAGSLIGGMGETQEMLDFCAHRRIVSDVEIIPVQRIEEAFARMLKGDVKYRFVIENSSLGK